jgi:signal transduction histidine kinase
METHFHIFVSLAFLAFYRDWRVLVPATLVIMADHVFRGLFFPQSIFGVLAASPWRLAEHAAWLLFEDIILVTACLRSVAEMREIMIRKAAIETLRSNFEHKYWARTAELKSANLELEDEARVRRQILQAQKLESIGQLAAGIAHEVNTPIQYIGDNCLFLKTSFAELHEILRQHLELLAFVKATQPGAELVTRLEGRLAEIDAAFLLEEIPKAIDQSIEGVGRVSQIVTAMKEFSHPGSGEKSPVDLNHAILNTLTVCRNEIKYAATVVTELDPSLPKVHCLTGQINQVILNLVVNAAQAMETTRPKGELGTIRITTSSDGTFVEMRVADNGSGIPEAIRNRIFDPFFTTKEVGKGSGQGLAIARNAIVNQHGGSLEFETEENVGTTFIVRIPIQPAAEPPVEKAAGYGKVTEELLNSR